jgi:hypothetical protein
VQGLEQKKKYIAAFFSLELYSMYVLLDLQAAMALCWLLTS